MKYIIFKQGCVYIPVIVPEHLNHCQVKIDDASPVSAGFFVIRSDKRVTVLPQGSESLKLKPDTERDPVLLNALLMNSCIYVFMDISEL